jgi:hypothetical protein
MSSCLTVRRTSCAVPRDPIRAGALGATGRLEPNRQTSPCCLNAATICAVRSPRGEFGSSAQDTTTNRGVAVDPRSP